MSGFEGSFLGHRGRIDPGSALECGVCWWVYDPAAGDDTWQVPPGTAFVDLPSSWRCPACDSPQEQFMVLADGRDRWHEYHRPHIPAPRRAVRRRERDLLRAFAAADERMRSLPVYNPRLETRVVGLQPWETGMVCVAATPWCMNIMLLPEEDAPPRLEGSTREVTFPSGGYTFVAGQLEGVGAVESCSLFSPMEQFDDPTVVTEVARHALRELLAEPDRPAMSRRRFLRGGKGAQDDEHPDG